MTARQSLMPFSVRLKFDIKILDLLYADDILCPASIIPSVGGGSEASATSASLLEPLASAMSLSRLRSLSAVLHASTVLICNLRCRTHPAARRTGRSWPGSRTQSAAPRTTLCPTAKPPAPTTSLRSLEQRSLLSVTYSRQVLLRQLTKNWELHCHQVGDGNRFCGRWFGIARPTVSVPTYTYRLLLF